nr:helix-turn-helix transcriptional regulator [uncultured Agathobaculum sp.]
MDMVGERLTYLLHLLGASGKTLAAQIGVDESTLSKWRRGKRALKYSSPYAKAIAAWALSCPAERESGAVRAMLYEADPALEGESADKLENALRLWLTIPDKPDDMPAPDELRGIFEVPLQTSIGLGNLFDAQTRLFHLLRSLPAGQRVTITDCGAVDWAHTDRTLLEEGIRANQEALFAGHHMRIIDQLANTYRPWDLMFQWLPVYLQPHVDTFFYRNPKPMPLRQNLIVIHGQAALVMSSTPAAPGLVVTSLYREPEYVRLFEAVAETILADSHPMMQVMGAGQLAPFLQMIEERVRSRRVLYMINRLPTFRNMPPALLDEILHTNGVEGTLYERCAAAGRQSATTRGRCECRQIYDLDALESAAARSYVIDADLSAVAGREIRLSRSQFLRQLAYLRERVRGEHYSMVVYPFSRLETAVPPCNMIVQDDSLAAAWDTSRYPCRLYSEEMPIISGFYEYAETLWESIPAVCKSESCVQRRMDTLLA